MDPDNEPGTTVIVNEAPTIEVNDTDSETWNQTIATELQLLRSEISDLRTEVHNHLHPEIMNRLDVIEAQSLAALTTSSIAIGMEMENTETQEPVEPEQQIEVIEPEPTPEPMPDPEKAEPKPKRFAFL